MCAGVGHEMSWMAIGIISESRRGIAELGGGEICVCVCVCE